MIYHVYGPGPSLASATLEHPSVGWNRTILKFKTQYLFMHDAGRIWAAAGRDAEHCQELVRIRDAAVASKAVVYALLGVWPGSKRYFKVEPDTYDGPSKRTMNYFKEGQLSGLVGSCSAAVNWAFQREDVKEIHLWGVDFFEGFYFNGDEAYTATWCSQARRFKALLEVLRRHRDDVKVVNHSPYFQL